MSKISVEVSLSMKKKPWDYLRKLEMKAEWVMISEESADHILHLRWCTQQYFRSEI